jgi:hypothetical protein
MAVCTRGCCNPPRRESSATIPPPRNRRTCRSRTRASSNFPQSRSHPHNIGRPNAAKHLDEALRYILGHDSVWNTTADDIAEYYIANYYDQVSSWIAEHKAPV